MNGRGCRRGRTCIIRRLKIEDAEEIDRIYAAITRKPVSADFKRVVEDHARREDGACFVAEMNGTGGRVHDQLPS
ncbi:MAG: hypothetical protein MZV70_12060 [Desulfobacterales bacterium]|nr:hypothetical protein [Desulfobacterales bacterium]